MSDIVMPREGLAMDEGTVLEWYFGLGEWVEETDVVLQAEGEKTTFEVPSHATGYLGEIVVNEGETVPVGTVLGRIYSREEWEAR